MIQMLLRLIVLDEVYLKLKYEIHMYSHIHALYHRPSAVQNLNKLLCAYKS